MMHSDDFDARISDWLREGPEEASRRPVAAGLAHAQAHPRRRTSVRLVPQDPVGAGWPGGLSGILSRRPLFAVAGLAAAFVIALAVSFGLPSQERPPSGGGRPGVGASESTPADLAALTGTWTDPGPLGTIPSTLAVVGTCSPNEKCGFLDVWRPSAGLCAYEIYYRGPSEDSRAFEFDALPTYNVDSDCGPAMSLVVTPDPMGGTLAVEENIRGSALQQKVFVRTSTP